jgi:hypothetical protein
VSGSDLVLAILSAVLAAIAWGVAAALRPRVVKDARAARSFLLPLILFVPALVAVVVFGVTSAVAPLACASAMCLAAAWLMHPTAATRFARFERQFWAHVHRDELENRKA